MLARKAYYQIKPLIPRWFQIELRRISLRYQLKKHRHIWPIDPAAAAHPPDWTGWPEGKRFAMVLTHDVESSKGQGRCRLLAGIEDRLGFRSSFNFVPEDYPVECELRYELEERGFEVGVHGLTHDGMLYNSHESFLVKAKRINEYLKKWGAVGFRSPAMHHNLEWIHELDIAYDASTFDTDPFEPQSDGSCTIFPFSVNRNGSGSGYVELSYTLPQDFTLFILLKNRNVDIWKKKLDWIAEHGGMALVNTHPDYMHFTGSRPGIEEYPASYYEEFLDYARSRYEGQFWHALPRDVARFWRGRGTDSSTDRGPGAREFKGKD